ncbi:MAG: DUF1830 domain-containing protein [Leptolyngbyaceae cyanobacterium bins.349]|nr:DUF1830 domain-containing protein [Leptolyngbyaceae cyanobacterium bins.349]
MMFASASPLSDLPDHILCYYVNTSHYLQRVCLANITHQEFERVIFPQQRFLFEAQAGALLEVYTWLTAGKTTLVKIPCLQLKVNEPSDTHRSDRRSATDAALSNADTLID